MQPIWPLAAALAHLQAAYLEVLSPMAIPSPHAWRALESVLSGVPSPEVTPALLISRAPHRPHKLSGTRRTGQKTGAAPSLWSFSCLFSSGP
ncbi:unnamed protein product [Rangifer tarandus platyrhynchus]|uniref:Secreted protein n=1 Tax=Rangifer tarandus platyrhynchus TaxID=3082113 RepID=A0ABN8ZGU9_RANTA|nr:unnamed protein product [Rangifer tarandus platyrhynchus]